jgi:hypothetical protein
MSEQAYFCAKVVNQKTDPEDAIRLAATLGLLLWIPDQMLAGNYTFPSGAIMCRDAIRESKAVICKLPIGRDCAWELGYAAGLGIPIYVLGGELEDEDWMTKIGVIYVREP